MPSTGESGVGKRPAEGEGCQTRHEATHHFAIHPSHGPGDVQLRNVEAHFTVLRQMPLKSGNLVEEQQAPTEPGLHALFFAS